MVAESEPQEEREQIEIGQPLDNPRREKFCALVANGTPVLEAFKQAGYAVNAKRTAEVNASKLRWEPEIAHRVAELVRFSTTERTLSNRRRRELLASIAETPATQFVGVDFGNAGQIRKLGRAVFAIKGIKTKSYTNDAGLTATETDIDLHDRIAAIREDAILAGERRTDGTQINIGGDLNLSVVLQSLRGAAGTVDVPRGTLTEARNVIEVSATGSAVDDRTAELITRPAEPVPVAPAGAVLGPLGPLGRVRAAGEAFNRATTAALPSAGFVADE